ncbi:MAG: DNA polymerase III subunit delta' [Deltaproteobacteria bacterium]|nr:DNA polymerase III subunit delta' [Deltaproteobacteria bacterium]
MLANAYLFSGPDGIGKKMCAIKFAMDINSDSCGSCPSCRKILHNTHPDLLIVATEEDKKDITIEQMRIMQSQIQMHPLEGLYKVIIIDNAEDMSGSAANSILKTLEEPPKNTIFILITSREHRLLPTILSRCQKRRFSPPSFEETVSLVKSARETDETTAKIIASVASGSPGIALKFPIDILKDVAESLSKLLSKPRASEVLAIAERWGKDSSNQHFIISSLLTIYNDMSIYQASKKIPIFSAFLPNLTEIAASTSPSIMQKHLASICSAGNDIETTYNKQLLFEQLLFSLSI